MTSINPAKTEPVSNPIYFQTHPIVLASASPRRKELLTQAGISAKTMPARIPEDALPEEPPMEFAKRMAGEKALHVATKLAAAGNRPAIVAADTIVVCDGQIIGKPADHHQARQMLGQLSGKTHQVITGWTVGRHGQNWQVDGEITEVTFLPLSNHEITRYIATGEPMDKAGAYAIQGMGTLFIEKIKGNYDNVVGLPVASVVRALKALQILCEKEK